MHTSGERPMAQLMLSVPPTTDFSTERMTLMARTRNMPTNLKGKMADGNREQDCLVAGLPLDPQACEFYRAALDIMESSGIEYLVGGAYAFERYTGIGRHTK